jgi:hypothetical protein
MPIIRQILGTLVIMALVPVFVIVAAGVAVVDWESNRRRK